MSTQHSPAPDPRPILDYIEAFRRSKVMFTAVSLGIFDWLEKKPQTAAELAAELLAHADALERLLSACVALGLLARDESKFRNTPLASRYLVSTSPHTFAGYIVYSNESLYRLWTHLDDAVREGSNRWQQVFGSRDALFDHFYRDVDATANFVRAMNGFGVLSSKHLVRAFDLGRFKHLVDLGGATGHLALAACEAYPNLRATVVDLPAVQPFALQHIAQSPVADRVRFVPADFFTDPLPHGDLYALGRILHDWDDARIRALLSKIAAALPPEGGLLIAEALLDDDRGGPVYAMMQDINMLVCTDGRERTLAEYRSLLHASGFGTVDGKRTGSLVDAILAIKQ